jgi:hypothetical protein
VIFKISIEDCIVLKLFSDSIDLRVEVWFGEIIVDWIELRDLSRLLEVVSVEGTFCLLSTIVESVADEVNMELLVLSTSFNELWYNEDERVVGSWVDSSKYTNKKRLLSTIN